MTYPYLFMQVCCKDLWYLETDKPSTPGRVQLVRASTNSLEVCWGSVPQADAYLLQIQKYDMPPTATAAATTPNANVTPSPITTSSGTVAPIITQPVAAQVPSAVVPAMNMMPVSASPITAQVASPLRTTSTPTIIRMASPLTPGTSGAGLVRPGLGTNVVRVRAAGKSYQFHI